jgi:acyloxyacyl hydrolase
LAACSLAGDSASAHFGIPAKYLMPDNQNSSSVYENLLPFIEDEADWPQCSWSTAFANDTDCPAHKLPINSIYQRMRARNLCNHRDYQNIGVNGGATDNMAPPNGIITALQRTKADAPANVFYALIGNDV